MLCYYLFKSRSGLIWSTLLTLSCYSLNFYSDHNCSLSMLLTDPYSKNDSFAVWKVTFTACHEVISHTHTHTQAHWVVVLVIASVLRREAGEECGKKMRFYEDSPHATFIILHRIWSSDHTWVTAMGGEVSDLISALEKK